MRLIIDIPEEDYVGICHLTNEQLRILPEEVAETLIRIADGTPIPDNAKNGDVIKAMFPTADISLNDSCFEGVVNKYGFDMKWWNAPYQKGGKE